VAPLLCSAVWLGPPLVRVLHGKRSSKQNIVLVVNLDLVHDDTASCWLWLEL